MTKQQETLFELDNSLKKVEVELSKLQQEVLKLRGELKTLKSKNNMFIEGVDCKLEKEITKSLTQLGIPINSIGFFYLRDMISLAVYDIERLQNISDMYTEVAKPYHSTKQRVERNIRTAITSSWNHSLMENVNSLFEYTLSSKPTNKEFIRLVADYFRISFFN